MALSLRPTWDPFDRDRDPTFQAEPFDSVAAETTLLYLAGTYFQSPDGAEALRIASGHGAAEPPVAEGVLPTLETRYRTLVEQIPAIVFMAYLDRGIGEAYVSPQIEEKLGFSQQEWLEDPVRWYQQIHPEDKQRWSVEAAQMFLSGRPLRSVYRVLARNGHVVWFHCEANMVRRPDGQPWFIHGVGVDISELKRTEDALRQSEERFRLLVSGVKDYAIFMLDPGGHIVSWNEGAEYIKGYREEEMHGKHFSIFYPEEDLRAGKPSDQLKIAAKDGRCEDEGWRVRKDGSRFWANVVITAVRDDAGRLRGFGKVTRDVSERRRGQEALQDERNILSAILDTVSALVVVLDPLGRIVRFNRACELTTGYSFEEVKNRYIWELFSEPAEVEGIQEVLAKLQAGETPNESEATWVTRQDSRRRVAWSGKLIGRQDGAAEYIIITGIDVTERQHLQKTVLEISGREQRRIGQDLHDGLGQHLTGVAFMSKVLEQKLAEKSLQETADARKILRLVNEAINKTRELARGLLPVLSDVQGLMSALKQLASEVEDLFRISCRFECEEQVLVSDLETATHLYHIAQEAVNNAIKHGKAKQISITLETANGSGSLTIRDDGKGFPVDTSNDTGMGLRIMRYRANMIGGTLLTGKNADGGTVIDCLFPLKAGSEQAR